MQTASVWDRPGLSSQTHPSTWDPTVRKPGTTRPASRTHRLTNKFCATAQHYDTHRMSHRGETRLGLSSQAPTAASCRAAEPQRAPLSSSGTASAGPPAPQQTTRQQERGSDRVLCSIVAKLSMTQRPRGMMTRRAGLQKVRGRLNTHGNQLCVACYVWSAGVLQHFGIANVAAWPATEKLDSFNEAVVADPCRIAVKHGHVLCQGRRCRVGLGLRTGCRKCLPPEMECRMLSVGILLQTSLLTPSGAHDLRPVEAVLLWSRANEVTTDLRTFRASATIVAVASLRWQC